MLRPTGKNSKGYANRMPEQTNGEGETRKKENIPRKSNSRGKREKKAGQGEKWKAKQIRPFLGDQVRERKREYSRETGKDCKAFCAEKRLRPKDGTVLKGEHW